MNNLPTTTKTMNTFKTTSHDDSQGLTMTDIKVQSLDNNARVVLNTIGYTTLVVTIACIAITFMAFICNIAYEIITESIL